MRDTAQVSQLLFAGIVATNVTIAALVAVAGCRDISSSSKKSNLQQPSRYGYWDSNH